MSVISAMWEADRRTVVGGQPGKKLEDPISETKYKN
jgi:hypothetical protein